jgi:sodium/bile acid cotransporter 7
MSGSAGVQLNPFPILQELINTVLLPTFFGKLVGFLPACARFAETWKTQITLTTLAATAAIPWMKISQSAESILRLGPDSLLGVVGVAVGIHLIYLAWNFFGTSLFNFQTNIKKSLIIMGSQKTLPVAMAILSLLPPAFGNQGIVAIPVIVSHFSEVMIDSFIAAWMVGWKLKPGEEGSTGGAQGNNPSSPAPTLEAEDTNTNMGASVIGFSFLLGIGIAFSVLSFRHWFRTARKEPLRAEV